MAMARGAAAALLFLCACVLLASSSSASASKRNVIRKVQGTSSWSLCASKTYPVKIEDVLISPDPVVAGQWATFTIPAVANEELSGGTVVVTVSFFGIKVHTEKDDLCSKSNCPINGEFTLNSQEFLPQYTPPGSYKLKFQVLDSNGNELTCASIAFSIVWSSQFEQLADATTAFQKKLRMRPFNALV
ncbi:unnamed protein product [Calypogeia fissa]